MVENVKLWPPEPCRGPCGRKTINAFVVDGVTVPLCWKCELVGKMESIGRRTLAEAAEQRASGAASDA